MAKVASTRSTCNSRPTGAVIVKDGRILATGYNGALSGIPHCTDQPDMDESPYCYRRAINAPEADKQSFCRSSHAEANAIAQAARMGFSVNGATVYCSLAPCYNCLKLMSAAGITSVYYELPYESVNPVRDRHWENMMDEIGMTYGEVVVSQDTIDLTISHLENPTSRRRLRESKK